MGGAGAKAEAAAGKARRRGERADGSGVEGGVCRAVGGGGKRRGSRRAVVEGGGGGGGGQGAKQERQVCPRGGQHERRAALDGDQGRGKRPRDRSGFRRTHPGLLLNCYLLVRLLLCLFEG